MTNVKLRSHTLVNGDYLLLNLGNWTVDTTLNENGATIWKYKVGSSPYWVPTAATKVAGSIPNLYKLPVYQNYSMTVNQVITIKVSHILPDNYQGVRITDKTWNLLTVEAYNSANTRL